MMYGCIGEHLSHSFSKEIHNMLADYEYELKELSAEQFDEFLKSKDFRAFNVTIPYKQKIIPYLDYVDELSREIGAVNTVVNRDGVLYGYNTDFYGLKALIEKNGIELDGKKVLILGSGGTSKTAFAVCKHSLADEVLRVSRTEKDGCITYSKALSEHNDAQIIINTTPCGMYPECSGTPIDISDFDMLEAVVDVVYNPLNTDLVVAAREKGIKACSGLYMLVAQAAFAVQHFSGVKISFEKIDEVYNTILGRKQNIVLIGMPSCGKTTNGKKLSEYLSLPFYDSDNEIQKREKMLIKEIFELKGEKYFRNVENEVLKDLSKLSGCIIATGGGAVLNPDNVMWLKKNGVVYFIDRELEKLVCTKSRPLSTDKKALKKLYDERYEIYKSTADFVLTSDNTFKEFKEIFRENIK